MKSFNQEILLDTSKVTLFIKREDLIHPIISGNKFRKLKYNLVEAQKLRCHRLLTFGGAYSNHIAAVAASAKENGFESIGIVRGEELKDKIGENPTLQFAMDCGMQLFFITREEYRKKDTADFRKVLNERFGSFYLLPEGGTNALAVKGCSEILNPEDSDFDYICCAVGTGGTIAGIINSSLDYQHILGFPSLKGDFSKMDIRRFASKENWDVVTGYDFGGYGKTTANLIAFMNQFYNKTSIPLDPVYTGKMIFGVMDLISKGFFPKGSKILAIHTGGLQGIKGMNIRLKNKKLPLIEFND